MTKSAKRREPRRCHADLATGRKPRLRAHFHRNQAIMHREFKNLWIATGTNCDNRRVALPMPEKRSAVQTVSWKSCRTLQHVVVVLLMEDGSHNHRSRNGMCGSCCIGW